MISIDAKGKALTKAIAESTLDYYTKEIFREEAYVKQSYPPVEFYGMKIVQDPNFPKDIIEIRDARGKYLAAIKNLAVL